MLCWRVLGIVVSEPPGGFRAKSGYPRAMTLSLYLCLKIRKERSPFVKYVRWERFACDRATWSRKAVRVGHRGGRPRPRGAEGHLPRPARAERGGQVHDDAHAHRPGAG